MSVRKREWGPPGQRKECWVVDYRDAGRVRRQETFKLQKDAKKFHADVSVKVHQGVHVADSASVTVAVAGEAWLASSEEAGLERTTIKQRREHLKLHICPFLGTVLLSRLNVPSVRAFSDRLRAEGRSPAMVKVVLRSLGMLIADAQERGLVAHNAVRDMSRRRPRGKGRKAEQRHKVRLQVGVDIPTPLEVRAIIAAANGWHRPLLITAIFTGLRASELRGLAWSDVDFARAELHVRRRADCYNALGPPKSAAGARTVPLPRFVVNTLREWKLACPRSRRGDGLDMVFPNRTGGIDFRTNIIERGLIPTVMKAGLVVPALDKDGQPQLDDKGQPILTAKYTGLHTLRHFYASWLINRRADGGQELPAQTVRQLMGHSTIAMTLDVYSHLFPRNDDRSEIDAAERALLG